MSVLAMRHIKTTPDSKRRTSHGIEVVYYLRLPDGRIKIGTSRDFLARVRRHRKRWGDVEVLAIEFGGRDLERQRHAEFADYRPDATELFHCGPRLAEHIADIAPA